MKTEHKKYRVRTTLTTIDGTLYENDVDLRVKDAMGRIWFLNEEMLV